MTQQEFEARYQALCVEIEKMPAEQQAALKALARETWMRREALVNAMDAIRAGMDDVRLTVKYLQFDLEATRRERDELRNALRTALESRAGESPDEGAPGEE